MSVHKNKRCHNEGRLNVRKMKIMQCNTMKKQRKTRKKATNT